jgi:glycosyltransferase involved in cell wall biosynthesis
LESLLVYKKLDVKVVLVLHNSPNNVYKERITPHIFPLRYYFKNIKLVGVSTDIVDEMRKYINLNKTQIQVIYNPFYIRNIQMLSKEKILELNIEKEIKYIVIVGSLDVRKRIDRAIYSFKELHKKDKFIKLLIIGKGPELNNLKQLVIKEGLKDYVIFLGAQKNPYKFMNLAKVLMLTSDSEGLPTVLIEALIVNIPVISTNCPTGPKEILIGELSKYLVDIIDVDEYTIIHNLSDKLKNILKCPPKIDEKYYKRFDAKYIINEWENI